MPEEKSGNRSQRARRGAGPVVAITGASAGVGRAIALSFARRGWRIALISRGRERLESAAREVRQAGGEALVLLADVADSEAVQAAADRIVESWGRLDVWVNNAMATVFGPVAMLTPEEIRRVTEVTYLGMVHGTLAALRHMRGPDRGTIVQVGSALAYRSIPLQSAYCAAKFAVRGFTDSLRSELIHDGSGIRLTMVQLPAVNTPQFDWARTHLDRALQPVPPIHAPEAVAEQIYRAAMTAPRELWIGSPTIQAILGTMVLPGTLDGMMARRAWKGQMTPRRIEPRPGNLFEPPPGDPGAGGRFHNRSKGSVVAVSGATARGALTGLGLAVFAGALVAAWHFGGRRTEERDHRLVAREEAARSIA